MSNPLNTFELMWQLREEEDRYYAAVLFIVACSLSWDGTLDGSEDLYQVAHQYAVEMKYLDDAELVGCPKDAVELRATPSANNLLLAAKHALNVYEAAQMKKDPYGLQSGRYKTAVDVAKRIVQELAVSVTTDMLKDACYHGYERVRSAIGDFGGPSVSSSSPTTTASSSTTTTASSST